MYLNQSVSLYRSLAVIFSFLLIIAAVTWGTSIVRAQDAESETPSEEVEKAPEEKPKAEETTPSDEDGDDADGAGGDDGNEGGDGNDQGNNSGDDTDNQEGNEGDGTSDGTTNGDAPLPPTGENPETPTTPIEPADADTDGVSDDVDNCVDVANTDQADADENGVGDACEAPVKPEVLGESTTKDEEQKDLEQEGDFPAKEGDADGDGIEDDLDNCALAANPKQEDSNGDDIGDACDEIGIGAGPKEDGEALAKGVSSMAKAFAIPLVDMCEYEGNGEYTSWGLFKEIALLHVLFHPNDIIEPFYFGWFNNQYFPGLNWDDEGQAIFNNGCQPVEEISCLLEDQDAIIIDTFTDTDGEPLGDTESGNGATPTPWIIVEGDWEILGGEAVRTGGGNNRVMTVVDSGVSDAAIEVVLSNIPNAANQAGVGLVFRYTDTSNFWYFHADPTRWYSLEKLEGGVHTQVATAPVVPQDGDTIRVLLDGPMISVYVNNVLHASVNDDFNQSAEMHGLKGTYWADEEDAAHDNFIITAGMSEACELPSYDWSDAPEGVGGGMNFPTKSVSNGARHLVVPGIFLGVLVDADNDGHPHDGAIGDDVFDGLDDEDGVVFTSPLTPGATSTATVTASVDGYLSAWFDFNLDGDWEEVDEKIFSAYALTAGENNVSFPVPAHATQDTGISRWRFTTTDQDVSFVGLIDDGEVEDYKFSYVADGPMCEEGPTWAASVVVEQTTQGTRKDLSAVLPARSDAASALGEPDGVANPASGFFSLGVNGVLTVEFDHYVENVDGVDLSFHEITGGNRLSYPEENADVEVSQNGTDWVFVGTVSSHDAIAYLDFDATGFEWITFVRLTDTTNFGPHANDADGYDIDAIDATNGLCEMPEPQPETSSVTICKLEDSLVGHALPDWTVMLLGEELETVEVNSDGTLASSQVLPADDYLFVANGVYNYRNAVGSTTDAAFSMRSYEGDPNDPEGHPYEPWVDVNDLLSPGYLGITVDGDIPGTDWGTVFNPLHQYALAYTSDGDAASFKIWDDGYNDNFGSLFVDIYESDESFVGVTEENGCVTFEDVPFGTYQLDEIMQDDWEFVESSADKDGNVEVDAETEEFYIVNTMIDDEDDTETVSGNKWNDLNDNGEWDEDEPGLEGWTIYANEQLISIAAIVYEGSYDYSTTTDVNGAYTLELPPGEYYVCEEQQDGWNQTFPEGCHYVNVVEGEGPYTDKDFGNHEEPKGDDDDDDDDSEEVIVVRQSDLNGWNHAAEGGDATGSFIDGPLTAPRGDGSFQMSFDDNLDSYALGMATTSIALADIEELEYSTFVDLSSPGTVQTIALQFNIDEDITDGDNAWKSRLVYEPYQSGEAVIKGIWQTWSPLDGEWWASPNASSAIDDICPQSDPCTLDEIITAYPNAGIHPTLGAIIFKAGSGWTDGFLGSVDELTIKEFGGTRYIFDFEPEDVGSDEPTLTLVKEIIGGDDDTFSFELSGVTSTSTDITTDGGEGSVEIVLGVGTTTITELLEQDWDLEDVVCEYYGDSEGVSVEGGHEIYAEEGDHITCTFTNEYVGGNSPTPSTGGGSGNSTSSARRSGFSGGGGEVLGATTDNNFCPFLLSYLHIDHQNDPSEVNKAKAFFNSYLGLNLPLDGTFDQGLFGAVVNFQNMFKPDILDTWAEQFDINDNPTGYIYQTTKWKINSIMCPGYETFPDLVLATNV